MRSGRVVLAWLLTGLALLLQSFAALAASASSWAELLRVVQLEAGGFVVFSLVEGKLVSRYFRGQREERK